MAPRLGITVKLTPSLVAVEASAFAGRALEPRIPARQIAFANVGIYKVDIIPLFRIRGLGSHEHMPGFLPSWRHMTMQL